MSPVERIESPSNSDQVGLRIRLESASVNIYKSVQKIGQLKCTTLVSESFQEANGGLVILNHGFGASGDDLVDIGAVLMEDSDAIAAKWRFLFPEAPIDLGPMGMPGGRAWWPINMAQLAEMNESQDYAELTRLSPPGMAQATKVLDTAVQEMRTTFNVPDDRIVLGGFSQGAMISTNLMLSTGFNPQLLALFSGTLLSRSEWAQQAAAHAPCRVLQSHGVEDPILPFGAAGELAELLSNAGFDVQFIKFHGGHTIPTNALQALETLLESLV